MTSKQEGPGKSDPRPEDAPGSKRPHATLDLKATEIKTAKPDEPKATASATSVPPTGAARPDDKSKSDTKPAAPASATSTAPKSVPPPTAPYRSGFGSFLTHMAAGIVGGFLALLGADTLGPLGKDLGLPTGGMALSGATAELRDRLAALEKSQRTTAADADLVDKLAATEGRLEQLDEELVGVREQSAVLQAGAKALADKLEKVSAAAAAPAASEARLADLEARLKALVTAGERDPDSGRIPQLAALTGKLADLEAALGNQIGALRQSVTADIDQRLAAVAEASEAAKAGTQRIDRQVAEVRTDGARVAQRIEALKADGERIAQTVRVVQEETGQIRSALDGLKGDVEARFGQTAKPADVAQAVSPVAAKIAALEQSLQGIVKAESERKTNAERILLSLELANLKRVIDRGQSFKAELAEVRKTAGNAIDAAPLTRFENDGVPTLTELAEAFRPIAHKIIDASDDPTEGSVVDRLLAGAKSVVRVRKVSHGADDKSTEAVVARMDASLKEGRLGDVMARARELPAAALKPAEDWLSKVAARHAVDSALAAIEAQLKTSLAGAGAPPAAKTN
ncbi:MAG: hypothetical protein AB1749_03820 [Pseudomonadota bacterium]